jgi:hypothetical protein
MFLPQRFSFQLSPFDELVLVRRTQGCYASLRSNKYFAKAQNKDTDLIRSRDTSGNCIIIG